MPEPRSEAPKAELKRRIAEYPNEALSFFTEGFSVASKLSEEVRKQVLQSMIVSLKGGTRRVGGSNLPTVTGLGVRDSERLASAFSLMIGLLSESTATPEDFLSVAKGVLFLPEDEPAASAIANSICAQRQEINAGVQRAQLAGEVLPSFSAIPSFQR
jgi:hypothetical protein